MKTGKWMAGLGLCAALLGAPAIAAPPSEAQVRQLMQLMGVQNQFTQMNSQMAGMMGQELPCVPASFWQNYIDKAAADQLTTLMIPVYQKHFTADDVNGLIKFYQSPLGQKLITEMPEAMSEAAQSAQGWGQQRTAAMFAQLQKEGKLDGQGRCPGTAGASAPPIGGPQ